MIALDQVLYYAKKIKTLISLRKFEEAEEAATKITKNIFENAPTLGLDLDGTIDEAPEFYKTLSKVWPGLVIIVTCRTDEKKAHEDAQKFGVYYDEIVLVKRLDAKAAIIKEYNIDVYVDDQDECLMDIPMDTTVLKMRNPGNFESGKWLYSEKTGEKI